MSRKLERVYDVRIVMRGDECPFTLDEASDYVRRQINRLYPEQQVEVIHASERYFDQDVKPGGKDG